MESQDQSEGYLKRRKIFPYGLLLISRVSVLSGYGILEMYLGVALWKRLGLEGFCFLIRACTELDSGMLFTNTYKSIMENYSGHGLTFSFMILPSHLP
jgi:hypothetical protein